MRSSRNDIFDRLSIIHKYCLLIGFMSYTIEGPPGSRCVKQNKLHAILTFPVHVMAIGGSWYIHFEGLKFLIPSPLLTFVTVLLLTADTTSFAAIIICSKISNEKIVFVLNQLLKFDREIANSEKRFKYTLVRNFVLIIWAIETVTSLALNLLFVIQTHLTISFLPYFILYTYTNFMQIAMDYHFLMVTYSFKYLFQKLNSNLVNTPSLEVVNKSVSLYQNFCRLARRYNRIFSLPILLRFASLFCMLLLQAFNFVVFVDRHAWITLESLASVFFMELVCLIKMLSFVIVSTSCMDQLKRTKQVIMKLLPSAINNADLRKNLNAFSLQILHEEFQINAGGFFPIDHSLGFSILSSLALYTIILVQFGISLSMDEIFSQLAL